MAIIECKNLTFSYPKKSDRKEKFVLSKVNFSAEEGQMILIYGASGSGKSTLLRLLKPEISPFGELTGEIFYKQKPLNSLSEYDSARLIGYVGQDPEASPVAQMPIFELAFLPQNLGFSSNDVYRSIAEIAAFFGLESIINKPVSELSGGQKQILNLAAVMSTHPKILLLDEPTAQLDPTSAENFAHTVNRIRTELGSCVIVCEHRTENFLSECHRILYLENGTQQFFLSPQEAAVQLRFSKMLGGFPTALQLSTALEENQALLSTADGINFLRKNFTPQNKSIKTNKEKTDENCAVHVKNVSFRYEKNSPTVIEDLDFKANFGTITAICGANGTGKSTLLKLISGVISPQEGKIFIDSKRIGSYKNGSLYKNLLAALPQNPLDILIEQTVQEDLSRTPDGKIRPPAQVTAAAKRFGIENLLGAHPYDLSCGEVKRAALAKLYLSQPKILLLDEPTGGLDPVCKQQLSELLRELAREGAAVIFVTHDLDFAAETSDFIALMFAGKVAACQPTAQLLEENFVYTTAAARISRGIFPGAVTTASLISACKKQQNEKGV